MSGGTVVFTVENGLCISCGICAGICPKEAVSFSLTDGMYYPQIDSEKCVECGLCRNCCPGIRSAKVQRNEPIEAVLGNIIACENAWSRDPELRHASASGGVVSEITRAVLASGLYECVFSLRGYDYSGQQKTELIHTNEYDPVQKDCVKSRYLPVSHENLIAYVKANRNSRVVVIGSPCALIGFLKIIDSLKLERENYLLIGLFCDSVFNYNAVKYIGDKFGQGRQLSGLHFKNKESGGWPGNMKLIFADNSYAYIDKAERSKIKNYFMPERCLYCIDKLNVSADISIGDNYTGEHSSELGSNTVIIRSERGMKAWDTSLPGIESYSVSPELLNKAQYLEGRINNLYFSALKEKEILKKTGIQTEINKGIHLKDNSADYERAMNIRRRQLRSGAKYDKVPELLAKAMAEAGKGPGGVKGFAEKVYYGIKRRLG